VLSSRAAPHSCTACDIHRTAGVYIATMMATVQTLQEKGHPYSEICNEVSVCVCECVYGVVVGGRCFWRCEYAMHEGLLLICVLWVGGRVGDPAVSPGPAGTCLCTRIQKHLQVHCCWPLAMNQPPQKNHHPHILNPTHRVLPLLAPPPNDPSVHH
jgi:hypothetical protein